MELIGIDKMELTLLSVTLIPLIHLVAAFILCVKDVSLLWLLNKIYLQIISVITELEKI